MDNRATPHYYGMFRDSVLRGEIPVNEHVSMEMNRIDEMIKNPDFYYDREPVEKYIRFCENELVLTDGTPMKVLESFKLWAESILCWYYYKERLVYDERLGKMVPEKIKARLTNYAYLIVGRGASKSLFVSSIQMYLFVADRTATEHVIVSRTLAQGEEILNPLRSAISISRGPLFSFLTEGSVLSSKKDKKVKLASTKDGIRNFLTNSLIHLRPMSIEKLQGSRAKYGAFDEWLSSNIRENPIETMAQSAGKNQDWLLMAVSSEGTIRNGIGDSIKMSLKDVLTDKVYNPHIRIWWYGLDDVKEIYDPSVWLKTNPNLGHTIDYAEYERGVRTAESEPQQRNDILAKLFGIPVEGFTYFFDYEETLPHRVFDFRGAEGVMGMDLSQGDDFCAFTFLFPGDRGRYGVVTRCYVTDVKMKKQPIATRDKFEEFVREGSLMVYDKPILDLDWVYNDIREFISDNNLVIRGVGYDPYGAEYFMEKWTREQGPFGIVKVRQGARTESVPLGELKNLASERLLIFYQDLMKYAMGNSVAIQDNNGNYKLSKVRASDKIDAVAALLDAWVCYKLNKEVFD